jgi:hypothetical protein
MDNNLKKAILDIITMIGIILFTISHFIKHGQGFWEYVIGFSFGLTLVFNDWSNKYKYTEIKGKENKI